MVGSTVLAYRPHRAEKRGCLRHESVRFGLGMRGIAINIECFLRSEQ